VTFTTSSFALFVAIVLAIYYAPGLRLFQRYILVLASIYFYGYGQPELLPLLVVAVVGTHALLILSINNRRLWLPVGIALN
jgi:alginate O-acetyltransferase complex protein AlgI